MLLEVREGVDEVRVEQSEQDQVRGHSGLGDLQAGQAGKARHSGQEGGLSLRVNILSDDFFLWGETKKIRV